MGKRLPIVGESSPLSMTLLPPPSPYIADILAQPGVLRQVLTQVRTTPLPDAIPAMLRSGQCRRVVLTGMGSSLFALYPLHLRLSELGIASFWVETSELLLGYAPLRARDTLLVAVSQSGESAELVALVNRPREFGHVIAATNVADSTLARAADSVLLLHAGPEATVSCKTYLATLAVLHVLAAELTGGDRGRAHAEVAAAEPFVREYLDAMDAHVAELAPWVRDINSLFVTGRGASLATAGTGGLILKEATRVHAEGMSAAAFRHGPLEMVGAHVLVLVLAGDARVVPLHRRLVDDVKRGGGRAVLVGPAAGAGAVFTLPALPAPLLPLVEILPVQMLTLAIAARDGREAGRFERATKVTTVD